MRCLFFKVFEIPVLAESEGTLPVFPILQAAYRVTGNVFGRLLLKDLSTPASARCLLAILCFSALGEIAVYDSTPNNIGSL